MTVEESPPDCLVIQFGNYCDRLVFLAFLDRNRHYELPSSTPFKEVIDVLLTEWQESPFHTAFIQEPETIATLLREYHRYNKLPIPSEHRIQKKVGLSEKFFRYITRRFADLFPSSQLVPIQPTIDDYIYHAVTGELLPPLGECNLSELHPSDRTYVKQVTPKSQKQPLKISELPLNQIKRTYPVRSITCECCDKRIPCPQCAQSDLLRGWGVKERTVALCYGCGILFFCDTSEILVQLEGPRESWGAQAIAIVAGLMR